MVLYGRYTLVHKEKQSILARKPQGGMGFLAGLMESGEDGSIPYAAHRYEVRSRAFYVGVAQRLVRWIANSVMRFRLPSPTLKDTSSNYEEGIFVLFVQVESWAPAHVAQLAEQKNKKQCLVFYGCIVQRLLHPAVYRETRVRFPVQSPSRDTSAHYVFSCRSRRKRVGSVDMNVSSFIAGMTIGQSAAS